MELYKSLVTVKEMVKAMDMCANAGMTPVFEGESGIGKTQQIRAYANDRKMDLVELNCATLFVEDFGAIRDDGNFVKFRLNAIFDIKRPTVVFYDEFSRARGDLRNALMSAINENMIYGTKLSGKIQNVVAMNPPTQDYGDTDDPFVDLATTRRYSIFSVIHKAQDWLDWAVENKVHEQVIRFIRKNEVMLVYGQACPRQWVKMSNVLKIDGIEGVRMVANGCLGIAARHFIEHLMERKVITVDDVLKRYAGVRDEVIKDKQLQLALGSEIAAKRLEKTYKTNYLAFIMDLSEEIRYQVVKLIVEQKTDEEERDMVYGWHDSNAALKEFMEKQSDY